MPVPVASHPSPPASLSFLHSHNLSHLQRFLAYLGGVSSPSRKSASKQLGMDENLGNGFVKRHTQVRHNGCELLVERVWRSCATSRRAVKKLLMRDVFSPLVNNANHYLSSTRHTTAGPFCEHTISFVVSSGSACTSIAHESLETTTGPHALMLFNPQSNTSSPLNP